MIFIRRILMVLFVILMMKPACHSQSVRLDMPVTLNMSRRPLWQVVDSLSRKADIFIAYSNTLFTVDKPVTVDASDMPLRNVLEEILEGTGYTYKLFHNQIVLQPLPKRPAVCYVTGFVREKDSLNPVPYATVSILKRQTGAIADINGTFEFRVSEEWFQDTLFISSIGYEPQLYDKTLLLGSTYHAESDKDYATFDFICNKTKTYQVLAFFREGKPGCMAAVLSMILPDSSTISGTTDKPERDILYMGIDNPLVISTSNAEQQTVNLSIDQGNIESMDGEYKARVIREGTATVFVEVLDSMGHKIETDSVTFEVRPMPLPVMMIAGRQSGTLSRQEILNTRTIDLWVPVAGAENNFSLVEYTLVTDLSGNSGVTVTGNQLPLRQKEAILNLTEGASFLLTNAVVSTPDGSTRRLPAQTYWLGW